MDSKDKNTSWEEVAVWYDGHLRSGPDTYQNQVILPNLRRLLALTGRENLLDLACGQGFFSHALMPDAGHVICIDASPTLVEMAKKETQIKDLEKMEFYVSESHSLGMLVDGSVDKIIIVLALQNIRELGATFAECARVLNKDGVLHIILNHPMFRVPKHSDWHYDRERKIMMREVDKYLSEFSSAIIMNPGSKKDKQATVSFHRPLSIYIKAATKAGLALSDLEEWVSHKESQPGPRAQAENVARNEIPLFMYLQFIKVESDSTKMA